MSRVAWSLSLAAAVASCAALSGCQSPDAAPHPTGMVLPPGTEAMAAPVPRPAESKVTIDNFAFNPAVLTVSPGTKVTWVNRDDVPHTATSSDSPAKFNSKTIDTDEAFSYVFTQPGTYPYYCAVHPKMTAQIVVK